MRICDGCHKSFFSKYENTRLCYNCYKKRDHAFKWHDHLVAENHRLEVLLSEEKRKKILPTEMARKLLMLAHPDRHNNSKLSNEVTKWLLSKI